MMIGTLAQTSGLLHRIPRRISGVQDAMAALSEVLSGKDAEYLAVLHVGDQLEHLQFSCHKGGLHHVIAPSKKIMADVLELGTKGLILAHNHTSGDPTPSPSDLKTTRYLVNACDALDVTILDHLIVADGQWISLRAMGFM